MKNLILILTFVLLTSCSEKTHYTEWDCGDADNKLLVKESLETCLKNSGASASTCGSIAQKLFCDLKRFPIRNGYEN